MQKTIYDFKDYRTYLLSKLGAEGTRTGMRKKASLAIRCHPTLLSQIFTGRAELNLEQAESMNTFLEHDDSEAEYFLLLVQHERAGSHALKGRLEKRISAVKTARLQISERIMPSETVSEKDKDEFYRTWIYGAIHVLVSIDAYQSPQALARALKLPLSVVRNAVDFLLRTGLVKEDQGKLKSGERYIHLKKNEPQIFQHHKNWRLHTIQSFDSPVAEDLHYSGAMTISKKDAEVVREKILKLISEMTEVIKETHPEEGYVIGFDFFRLGQG